MKKSIFLMLVLTVIISVFIAAPVSAADKVLKWQYNEPQGNPDPAVTGTTAAYVFISMIHDALIGYDEAGEAIPWLAESFEPNEDFSAWTFKIRENAKFSDGSDLTAEDVAWTIDHYKNSKQLGTSFSIYESVEIVDEHTVIFHLTRPTEEFLYLNPIYILSKTCDEGCDYTVPGTPVSGAWYVTEYEPKYRAVLTKNAGYWMEGFPKFDVVDYLFVADRTAMISAIEAGERDISYLVQSEAARFVDDPNVKLWKIQELGTFLGFAYDISKPPFDSKLVRQAMGYITEPAQKTEVCWYGYAENGYGGYVFDTDKKYYPVLGNDPWKGKTREERIIIAKDLLAQAGWTDQNGDGIVESKGVPGIPDGTNFSVTLDYESTWAAAECHSLLMSEWAKEAGMEIIPNSYDGATFWSDAIAGKHQMWHLGLSLTQLPWERFRMAFHSKGEWTSYITHVNDPKLDKMIDDAIAATNMDDKLAKTKIAHDYLVDQQYITNDGAQDMGWITNAKLEGFYASPQNLMWTRSIIISDIADR